MNIKKVIAAIAAMSLLTGCGEKKTSENDDSRETSTVAATTEAATDESTTETADEEDYIELTKKLIESPRSALRKQSPQSKWV